MFVHIDQSGGARIAHFPEVLSQCQGAYNQATAEAAGYYTLKYNLKPDIPQQPGFPWEVVWPDAP
jgi:hypothetical protein